MSKKRNNITSESKTIVENETQDEVVETVVEPVDESPVVEDTVEETPVNEETVTNDEPVVTDDKKDEEIPSEEPEKVEDVEPVDESPVVEDTVEETPVNEETVTDGEPVDESPVVETPVNDETVTDGEPVDESPVVEDTVEETPVNEETTEQEKVENDENINPVTENVSGKQEISGKNNEIQIELCKKYKCKFAQSYFMKICATSREFSLFSMIETYLMNKTAYIGLTSLEDFNHIKDVMENNNISFKYKILDPYVKKQFLQKLEFNTQYAVTHK